MIKTENREIKNVITAERKMAPQVESVASPGIPHRPIFYGALLGAIFGGLILGLAAYLVSTGHVAINGLGMLSASGPAPATFVGGGLGIALGGVTGALLTVVGISSAGRRNK